MRIEGTYTFNASRDLVRSLLLDPLTIRQSLPGCDEFDQITNSVYVASLHIKQGPFKGQYHGQIELMGDESEYRYGLVLNGAGPEGTILGNGTLSCGEHGGNTTVQYEGDVQFAGFTAVESPRMLRTTANALIRKFFEAFERQVRAQTGIHTTSLAGHEPRTRVSGTVDRQDVIAEIKQNRQIIAFLLALIAFVLLACAGAFAVLLILIKWGKRTFDALTGAVFIKDNKISTRAN